MIGDMEPAMASLRLWVLKNRRNCVAWSKYLIERFGENTKVLLHGVYMGGATVLSASGEEDLPQ